MSDKNNTQREDNFSMEDGSPSEDDFPRKVGSPSEDDFPRKVDSLSEDTSPRKVGSLSEDASLSEEGSLLPGERIDELQRNGYKIIQNSKKFCFGMDAVLLSGFAKVKEGEKVLDLGTGTGIIPILLEAKTKGQHFTGLELQEESADMARRSVRLNKLEQKISIVTGDIKEAGNIFGAASFHVVTSNPPYMNNLHGLKNPDLPKAIARHEIYCTLEDVIREGARVLKTGGRFYLVHRPFRLIEIINTLTAYKLEPKRMKMVHPFVDKEPNMVLIEAVKGGGSMLSVEPPLIVYREVNRYTDEIYDLYGY